jgi:hypothetical protein
MQDFLQSLDLHFSADELKAVEYKDLNLFIVTMSAERIKLNRAQTHVTRIHGITIAPDKNKFNFKYQISSSQCRTTPLT